MNIKKLFAVLAGVSMLANVVLPGIASAATPDAELEGAYEWAHDKGVTTMSTFEAANMYGAITRAEMAKMLSVYAVESLGYKADSSKACAFSDIASVKGDLHDYIIESCQLGVMGQGITAFRPYDTISRAEFGTALSRVLWGNKYEGGNPYYANHLNALKSAGIMNQITNAESTKEVRGYVMLMLQRSDEGNSSSESSSSTDCDDAAIALACKLGSDLCPAKCKAAEEDEEPAVVKAGDLVVTARAADGRKVIASGAVSELDTLTFKTSENVEITKVTLEKYGYSDGSAVVANVWLEDADGNKIADPKPYNASKDQVTLNIKKDYRNVDGSMSATVVVETNTGATYVGGTIGFKVVSVDSTAENLNLDDYTPYEYDIVVYNGTTTVTLQNKGAIDTYNYEAGKSYEISRFRVTAGTAPVIVKGFKLTTATVAPKAKIDLNKYLEDVEVTADGKTIKAKYSIDKNQVLTISFDDIELESKKNIIFAVSIVLNEDFNEFDTYAEYGIAAGDFTATEKKTGARITTTALGGSEYRFKGGKIKLSNTKGSSIDAAKGSTNVVFAQGSIEIPEALTNVEVVVKGTVGNCNNDIDTMTLVVAGDSYDASVVCSAGAFTGTFSSVDIEKSGKFQLKLDLGKEAVGPINFSTTINNATFAGAKYDVSDKPVDNVNDVAGFISLYNITIKAPEGSMENDMSNKDVEFIIGETSKKTVFDGTYTAKKDGEAINLNTFWLTGTEALPAGNTVEFYVSVDGKDVGNTKVLGREIRFDNILVKAGNSVSVKVEAVIEALTGRTYTGGNYSIWLKGETADEERNEAGTSHADLNGFKVKESGSVTIPAVATTDTALLKASNTVIAQFTVKPSNGSEVDLDNIVLTGAQFTTGNFKVTVDGTEYSKVTEDAGVGYIYAINKKLPAEGYTVKVIAKKALTGDVSVKVVSVNDKPFGNVYSKYFVESLVSFATQEEGSASTTYTLAVEHSDDAYTITGYVLTFLSGDTCTGGPTKTLGSIRNGEDFTIYRGTDAQVICQVDYKVMDGNNVVQNVTISKSAYKAYFKAGGKEVAVPAK